MRARKIAIVALCELVECLDTNMQLLWPVKFRKVRNDKLGFLDLFAKGSEIHELRHLDLRVDTATLVCSQIRDITNGEGVRPLHSNFARSTTVETLHALDLGESHKITVLQAVTGLVKSRDQAILVDSRHNSTDGLLTCRITDSEVLTEVIEEITKETEGIRDSKVNAILVAEVGNRELILQRSQGEDNSLITLQLFEVLCDIAALMDCDGDVGVELCDSGSCDLGTRLADVLGLEEELGGQVRDGDRGRIVQCEGLHTGKGDVLGW